MIEKVTIKIKEKEYSFLKPAAIDIVEIERKSFANGKFNSFIYEDCLLSIVSKDINKESLVKFNGSDIELSSGVILTPQQISFKQYEKMTENVQSDNMSQSIGNYLKICGNEKIDIRSLTKEDIYKIYDAYVTLYDRSELDDVLEKLNSFC